MSTHLSTQPPELNKYCVVQEDTATSPWDGLQDFSVLSCSVRTLLVSPISFSSEAKTSTFPSNEWLSLFTALALSLRAAGADGMNNLNSGGNSSSE